MAKVTDLNQPPMTFIAMTPEKTVRQQYEDLTRWRDIANSLIAKLREECEHTFASYSACANTGNYDPGADAYWYEWTCDDCGKRWDTPQGNEYIGAGHTLIRRERG